MADFIWPAPGNSVVTQEYSSSHKALDIDGKIGDPLVASRSGEVVKAYTYGRDGNSTYGSYVDIKHDNGFTTRYAHMHSVGVYEGQVVTQGQSIGQLGNTGRVISSGGDGSHLHFEIISGSTKLPPRDYLDKNTSSSVSNSVKYTESVTSPVSYDNVPYTPLAIVGKRVSEITSQPMHPYVKIWVGDTLLSTEPPKPNIIQSFTFNRLESAGSTAEFVLFDDNWDVIEETFANNWDNIYLEYGYVNGLSSERYHMLLQNYSISFNSTGVVLSIRAVSESVVKNLETVNIYISEGTTNPTEAIRQICRQMSWNYTDLEETTSINGEDLSVEFNSVNEHPVTYIMEVILPMIAIEGEDTMTFYVDENNNAHLRRKSAAPSNIDSVRTYIFQKGYDSVVKDLVFDYKGTFGGMTLDRTGAVTGGRVGVIDTNTKENTNMEKTIADVGTTSATSHLTMRSDQSVVNIDSAGYTQSQMSRRLYYYIKNSSYMSFSGTMTIVGDPTVALLDHIRLVNLTDQGYLHHTSGIYMVKGISTSFSGGEMTTALTIIRNGDINQGVELINAKHYVK